MRHDISELANIETEEAVLGMLMVPALGTHPAGQEWLPEVRALLKAEDFYCQQYGLIYKAMLALYDAHTIIDLVTLNDYLKRTDDLERIGGLPALTKISNSQPSAVTIMDKVRTVKDYARRRAVVAAAKVLESGMYAGSEPTIDSVTETQQTLARIVADNATVLHPPKEVLLEILGEVGQPGPFGLSTGFSALDDLFGGGLQKTWIYVFAARPSVGKTAFVGNIADNICAHGGRVLWFSFEMSRKRLLYRLLARRAGVPLDLIHHNMIGANEEQLSHYYAAAEKISKYQLEIYDESDKSINAIIAKATAIKAKYGLDLIVIDHLQIMDFEPGDRNAAIGTVCSKLQSLAVTLDLPIIEVSQLSRDVTKRADKQADLQDLRDSGNIEQDADVVAFVDRPRYNNQEEYDRQHVDDNTLGEQAFLNVRKNRDGKLGKVELKWFGEYQTFASITKRNDAPEQIEQEKAYQPTIQQAELPQVSFAKSVGYSSTFISKLQKN